MSGFVRLDCVFEQVREHMSSEGRDKLGPYVGLICGEVFFDKALGASKFDVGHGAAHWVWV
jgi:hypothetical protein